jgi:hypothetical protein
MECQVFCPGLGRAGLYVRELAFFFGTETLLTSLYYCRVWIPNFTGSTGFGQQFVDAVAGDGGDAPFVDMRIGWAELLKQYPAVDSSRAAAIGGSWGGYGVNLIQGHPEWNFGFKALVSHCGEFDLTYGGYLMDEQTIVSGLRVSSF